MIGQPPSQPALPPMQPVNSTHLAAAGHDPRIQRLAITFHNGDVYGYDRVPAGTYVSMLAAKSIGGFFNAHIRAQPSKYPATKLHDHRQKTS